jgi:oligoendopeptidase F
VSTETIMPPEAPKPLPKRDEVPVELTWDLSVVYEKDELWESDFKRVEEMSEPLQELQGKLNDASNLLRGLQMQDEVGTLFSQLYSYASLRRSEDNANPDAQARVDRVRMLGTRLSSATAFVEPEILAIEPQQLRNFIEQEDGLKLYEYYLQKLERRRPHVRTPEVEEVLALGA